METSKRKWIVLQPEVRSHLSLWYVLADDQTNRPYSFPKHAYKILGNTKFQKLKKEKSYEWFIFFISVFCQLSVSCEIYSYHGRISSVLRQNRKKGRGEGERRWQGKLCKERMHCNSTRYLLFVLMCCYHRRYYNSQQGRHYRRVSIGGSFNGWRLFLTADS